MRSLYPRLITPVSSRRSRHSGLFTPVVSAANNRSLHTRPERSEVPPGPPVFLQDRYFSVLIDIEYFAIDQKGTQHESNL